MICREEMIQGKDKQHNYLFNENYNYSETQLCTYCAKIYIHTYVYAYMCASVYTHTHTYNIHKDWPSQKLMKI